MIINKPTVHLTYLLLLLLLISFNALGFELKPINVTGHVWALVGDIGPRTKENHALNNTLGFIITDQGVILVGSGATPPGAELIAKTIAKITTQPIRWVINIGTQDHHWLGNRFFAENGTKILALKRTVDSQKANVTDHLARLQQITPEGAALVIPRYADRQFSDDHANFNLGGMNLELIWPGKGHFPGDAVLWLPDQKLLFAGDFVFNDRLLGILEHSSVLGWRDAFRKIAALMPAYVVPGHGFPGKLVKAQRDTGDYLDYLVNGITQALDDWQGLAETTDVLSGDTPFKHLKFYQAWHRKNINRAYLQIEAQQ